MKEFCLIARSGDCAAGGLGKHGEVIPFDSKHKEIVAKFLKAQYALKVAYGFMDYEKYTTRKKSSVFYGLFGDLKDLGIFDHKWHARTEWDVEPYSDGCVKWFNDDYDYGPFKLADHIQ
jgi:hypothetical protein